MACEQKCSIIDVVQSSQQTSQKSDTNPTYQPFQGLRNPRVDGNGMDVETSSESCIGILPDVRQIDELISHRKNRGGVSQLVADSSSGMEYHRLLPQVLPLPRRGECVRPVPDECGGRNGQPFSEGVVQRDMGKIYYNNAYDPNGRPNANGTRPIANEDRQKISSQVRSTILGEGRDAQRRAQENHHAHVVGDPGCLPGPGVIVNIQGTRREDLLKALWRGAGSDCLSGNHQIGKSPVGKHPISNRQQHVTTNGSKPPIYAPRTKKVGVAELKNDLGDLPIYRWLDDKELYVKLLRGKERRRASKFYNTVTESDLAQLLEAGIVEEASRPLKAFVKIFLVSEKGNTRSRVIIEPREINRAIKEMTLEKVSLPSVRDVVELCRDSMEIESIDFRSYFYQIELAEEVRPYFGAIINGKDFQVRVLPQGGCASVLVAQKLALAATAKAVNGERGTNGAKVLVYIDNIYIGYPDCKMKSIFTAENQPFEVGSRSRSRKANVLGTIVDCVSKTIDISDKTRQNLTDHGAITTYRDLLSAYGLIAYTARILHIAMHDYWPEMKILAKICSNFLLGKIELEESLPEHSIEVVQNFLARAKNWGPATCAPYTFPTVVFTDASMEGGGCLIVEEDSRGDSSIRAHAWKWCDESFSINMLELRAIEMAINYVRTQKGILLFSDSAVAVHLLRKGYSTFPPLNEIVGRILDKGPEMGVVWIPGLTNPADAPSRNAEWDGEVVSTGLPEQLSTYTEQYNECRLWYDSGWKRRRGDANTNSGT